MIPLDHVSQQIDRFEERVRVLRRRARERAAPCSELLPTALSELNSSVEELQVAYEELRQQNEELAGVQKRLELERQRYEELFQFAPDGYLVTDADGTIREANRAAARMLAIAPEFLLGKPLANMLPAEERREFRLELLRLRKADRRELWGTRVQPRQGTPFEAAFTVAARRDAEGRLFGLRWLMRDVTAIRQAQEQVRQLNARLEARAHERTVELEAVLRKQGELLERESAARAEAQAAEDRLLFLAGVSGLLCESLDSPVVLTRLAQMMVPFLAEWCAIDLVEGKGLRRVAMCHAVAATESNLEGAVGGETGAGDASCGRGRVLASGEPELYAVIPEELREALAHDCRDAERVQPEHLESYLCLPLPGREGVIGTLTLVRCTRGRRYDDNEQALGEDLARRIAAAVENARLYDEAQKANRQKDGFAAAVGHELRGRLSPMRAAVHLLRQRAGDPVQVNRLADTLERNLRMQTCLLNDLVELTRQSHDKLVLQPRPTFLAEVVTTAVEEARADAAAARLELVWEVPATPIHALVDSQRMLQVLQNLIANAIKFTPAGGQVRVALTRVEAEGEAPGRARLEVADTGIGLASEARERIFHLFQQEENAMARSGLGIGLALVDSLVRRQGGRVWVESDGPEQGSRFLVEFPALSEAAVTSA
jgi:PAS domain S-box-containing protein